MSTSRPLLQRGSVADVVLSRIAVLVGLLLSPLGSATSAHADWPTPLIAVRCLPAMHLMTLDIIAEWNLCTHQEDCKVSEDQGTYPDEQFLQQFKTTPFMCQVNRNETLSIVPHVYGTNSIGQSTYTLTVLFEKKSIYIFRSDGYNISSLNLVVDGSLGRPLLMACLMRDQSILALPASIICKRSGLSEGGVTFRGGEKSDSETPVLPH